MKFHLPPSLRKALLACLAAVASITAPVATTVASGSFAVGLVGYAMIAGDALAEEPQEPQEPLVDESQETHCYSLEEVTADYTGKAPIITLNGVDYYYVQITDPQGDLNGATTYYCSWSQVVANSNASSILPDEYEKVTQLSDSDTKPDSYDFTVNVDGSSARTVRGTSDAAIAIDYSFVGLKSGSSATSGGAIHNNQGEITSITGDFVNNSASGTDCNTGGGAIMIDGTYDDDDTLEFTAGITGDIIGDFIGNHVIFSGTGKGSSLYARGGAIYNDEGQVGNIVGDFINNYSISIGVEDNDRYAYGGAIAARQYASFGDITGDFISNYTYASHGDTKGGAIYMYKTTISSLTGDFIANYNVSENYNTYGGAISAEVASTIGNINGSFIGNHTFTSSFVSSKTSYGGAIYLISNQAATTSKIGNITGDFINNYAGSLTSITRGGAIYSRGASNGAICQIGDITGSFIGNYITLECITKRWADESLYLLGGAIYNEYSRIGNIVGDFIGNYTLIADDYDLGEGEEGYDSGEDHAQYYDSGGSAIYNENGIIGNITGSFIGNKITYGDAGGSFYSSGAIHNMGGTPGNPGTASLALLALGANVLFEGNYERDTDGGTDGNTPRFMAIDNSCGARIYMNAYGDNQIIIQDAISGLSTAHGYISINEGISIKYTQADVAAGFVADDMVGKSVAISGAGDLDFGTVQWNNEIYYQDVDVFGGTLQLGEYDGGMEVGVNGETIKTKAAQAEVYNCNIKVLNDATLKIACNDVVFSDLGNPDNIYNCFITIDKGGVLDFGTGKLRDYNITSLNKLTLNDGSILNIAYDGSNRTALDVINLDINGTVSISLNLDFSTARDITNASRSLEVKWDKDLTDKAGLTESKGLTVTNDGGFVIDNITIAEGGICHGASIVLCDSDLAPYISLAESLSKMTVNGVEYELTFDKDTYKLSFTQIGLAACEGYTLDTNTDTNDFVITTADGNRACVVFNGVLGDWGGDKTFLYTWSKDATTGKMSLVEGSTSGYDIIAQVDDDLNKRVIATGDIDHSFIGLSGADEGGAIYLSSSDNNTVTGDFIGNSANYGGAIYSTASTNNTVTGDFIGNSAIGNGGAIYSTASNDNTVTGDFIGNSAGGYGGAICMLTSSLTLLADTQDISFTGNTAVSGGEAIYMKGGSVVNMHAAADKSITFNDTIVSADASDVINIGGTVGDVTYAGTVNFNAAVDCAGTIKLEAGTTTLGQYTDKTDGSKSSVGSISATYLQFNGGKLDLACGAVNADAIKVTNLVLNANSSLSLDVDLSTGFADMITADAITNNGNYSISLDAINWLGESDNIVNLRFQIANDIAASSIVLDESLISVKIDNKDYKLSYDNTTGWLSFVNPLVECTGYSLDTDTSINDFVITTAGGTQACVVFDGVVGDYGENKTFFYTWSKDETTGAMSLSTGSASGYDIIAQVDKDDNERVTTSGDIDHSFIGLSGETYGGAINLNNSANNTVSGDFINNSTSGTGGAIYLYESNRNTVSGDFIGNSTSGSGGAIYLGESERNTVSGDFIGNSSANMGGAIYFTLSSTNNKVSGDFIGNSASGNGGAIYSSNSTDNTVSGDFIGNSSGEKGGAIYLYNSSLILLAGDTDMLFDGNTASTGGEAIYMQGDVTFSKESTLNMHAAAGKSITFNDTIVSDSTNNTINIGSDSYTGTVNFNAAVSNMGDTNLLGGKVNLRAALSTGTLTLAEGTTLDISSAGSLVLNTSLSNSGAITGSGSMTLNAATTAGGNIALASLSLEAGESIFGDVDVTTLTINGTSASLGNGSAITNLAGSGTLITNDTVSITNTTSAASLNVASGTTTLDGTTADALTNVTLVGGSALALAGELSISGKLNNAGSITGSGSITLSAATTAGGDITATSLSVADGANSFDTLNITDTLTNAGGTLTLNDSAKLGGLANSGVIDAGSNSITMSGVAFSGGDIKAGDLTLVNGENVFGALTLSGTLTNVGGTLELTKDASLANINNSDAIDAGTHKITMKGVTSTGGHIIAGDLSLVSGANAFSSLQLTGTLTNAGGTLRLLQNSIITDLDNSGLINAGSNTITMYGTATKGGDITASALVLMSGASSFDVLTLGELYFKDSTVSATLQDGSTITTLSGSGTLIANGAVGITKTSSASSLNVASGTTTLDGLDADALAKVTLASGTELALSGSLTIGSSLDNSGSITGTGDIVMTANTTTGGDITAKSLTLNAGANTFGDLVLTDSLSNAGALTVDSFTGTFSNTGKVAATSITATAQMTAGGNVNVAGLTLVGSGNVFGAIENLSRLTITGALTKGSTVLAATSLDSTDLAVALTSAQISALNLTVGDSLNLISLTNDYAGDFSLLLDDAAVAGSAFKLGDLYYTIDQTDKSLSLAVLDNNYWNVAEGTTGNWEDASSWAFGKVPDDSIGATLKNVNGVTGAYTLMLNNAESSIDLTLDAAGSTFTLDGEGSLSLGDATLSAGTLSADVALTVADGTMSIAADATLDVLANGVVTVDKMSATGAIANAGSLSVGDGSILTSVSGAGTLATTGSVGITNIAGNSLNVQSGTTTIDGISGDSLVNVTLANDTELALAGDLSISGTLNNAGSITGTGNIDLIGLTSAGGDITATSLSVANGANSFDTLVLTGTLTNAGGTLTLNDSAKLGGLANSGLIDAGSNSITMSGVATNGGDITATDLTLVNGENVFGALTLSGTLTNVGGTLELTKDASLANINNSDAIDAGTHKITMKGVTSTGGHIIAGDLSLVSGANTFSSLQLTGTLTNAGGTLSLLQNSMITDLDNSGLINAGSNSITMYGTASKGGDITASALVLMSGASSFDVLTLGELYFKDSAVSATLQDGSTITTLSGSGTLIANGAVGITNTEATASLNVASGKTTIDGVDADALAKVTLASGTELALSGSLTIGSSLDNSGSITGTGDIVMTANTTTGGDITAKSLTLAADTDNTFGDLVLTDSLSNAGTLTVESFNGTFSNTGTVKAASITATAQMTAGGNVDVASMTIVGSGNRFGAIENLSRLTITGALTKGSTVLAATSLDSTDLAVSITSAQISALNLTVGDSLNLISLTNDYAGDFSLLLDDAAVAGSAFKLGDLYYTIDQTDKSLSLAVLDDNYWNVAAGTTGNWEDASSWVFGKVPDDSIGATLKNVNGATGEYTLTLNKAESSIDLTLDAAGSTFTLDGTGSLSLGDATLSAGTLSADVALTVDSTMSIAADATLDVLANGVVSVGTMSATGAIANAGSLSVGDGSILTSVSGTGTLATSGELGITDISGNDLFVQTGKTTIDGTTADSIANLKLNADTELALSGELSVTADSYFTNNGSITGTGIISLSNATTLGGNITANSLTLASGTNKFGTLTLTGTLTNAGGTLTLTDSAKLGGLDNSGLINAGTNDITMTGLTALGGKITAANLTLVSGANSFGALTLSGTLTNAGGTLTLTDSASLANINNSGLINADGNNITMTGLTTTGGNIAACDLTLVSGANSFGALTLSGTLTNAGDTLTLTGAADIATLDNKGSISAANQSITLDSVTTGGNITAGNLTVTSGASSFDVLDVDTLTINGTSASVGTGTDITTLTGTGTLIANGAVAITDTTSTASLNVASGKTTLDGASDDTLANVTLASGTELELAGSLTIGNSLNNSGVIKGASNITLSAATTTGGDIYAGNLTVASGTNSFDELLISGTLTNAGTTTITEASSIYSLNNSGSIIANKTLTLLTQTTNGGDLTIKEGLTVIGATVALSDLTMAADTVLTMNSSADSCLSAKNVSLGSSLTLQVNGSLGTEQSIISGIDSITIDGVAFIENLFGMDGVKGFVATDLLTVLDGEGAEVTLSKGAYVSLDDAGNLVLHNETLDLVFTWDGAGESATWSTDAISFEGDAGADTKYYNGFDVVFEDAANNASEVVLDGALSAYDMTVSDDFTFTGEGDNDSLTITNTLSIGAGATMTFKDADLSLNKLAGTGKLDLGTADLTLKTIANTGLSLTAGNLTLAGDANKFNVLTTTGTVSGDNDLTVGGGSSINRFDGDKLTVSSGTATLGSLGAAQELEVVGNLAMGTVTTGGTLDVDGSLTLVDGANEFTKLTAEAVTNTAALTLGGGSTLDSLSGGSLVTTGTVKLGTLLAGKELAVTGDLTFSDAVSTGSLDISGNVTLAGDDNVFTKLEADGTVSGDDNLSVGDGSSINSFVGDKLTVTSGTATLGSLNAAQELEVVGNLTMGNLTTGGTLDVSGELTLKDGTNEFTKLTAGTVTNTGTLTLGDGSELDSLSGGNLTVDSGTVTIKSNTTLVDLDNSGTLDMGSYSLKLTAGTEDGGTLIVGDLSLTANNSFTKLTAGAVTNTGTLTLGDGSELTSLSGGNLTVDSGTVTIKSNTTLVDLDNSGTLDMSSYSLSLTAGTEDGGTLIVGGLGLTANNEFTKLTAGAVTNTGTLTLGAGSELDSLSGGNLTVDSGTVTIKSNTELNKLSGTGSLKLAGDLTLNESSSIGALTVDANLTLNDKLNVDGALQLNGSLVLTQDALAVEGALITAGSLVVTGGTLDISIDQTMLDDFYAGPEVSHTIFDLDTAFDGTITINGENPLKLGDGYNLEMTVVDGELTFDYVLSMETDNNYWTSADGVWGDASGNGWTQGETSATLDAVFHGQGKAEVVLSGKQVAKNTIVDAAGKSYSFNGDALTTETLQVIAGDLTINNKVSVTGASTVATDGSLTVGTTGELDAASMRVTGSFANSGDTTVTGSLVAGDLTNSGSLSMGEGSAVTTLLGKGTTTITGNASITDVTEASLNITAGETKLDGTTADSLVDVSIAKGAELSSTDDLTINGTLDNSGQLDITGDLTLAKATLTGGDITMGEGSTLFLTEADAYKFGTLNTDVLDVADGTTVSFASDSVVGKLDAEGDSSWGENTKVDEITGEGKTTIAGNSTIGTLTGGATVELTGTGTEVASLDNATLQLTEGSTASLSAKTGDETGKTVIDLAAGSTLNYGTAGTADDLIFYKDELTGAGDVVAGTEDTAIFKGKNITSNVSVKAGTMLLDASCDTVVLKHAAMDHLIIQDLAQTLPPATNGIMLMSFTPTTGSIVTADYMLQMNSISDYAGSADGTVSLTLSALTSTLANGDYNVIKNTGDVSWADFSFSDATWGNISALAGKGQDVILTTSASGVLGFTLKSTEGRSWSTSEAEIKGEGALAGVPIFKLDANNDPTTELSSQDVFDYIESTHVDADVDITLLDCDTSDASGNIIEITNLSGDADKCMSIVGDGIDDDVVALDNTATTKMDGTLDVTDLTLRFTDAGDQKIAVDTIKLTDAKLDLEQGNGLDLSTLEVDGDSQLSGDLSLEELAMGGASSLTGGTITLEDADKVSIDDSASFKDVTLVMADADGTLDLNADVLDGVTLAGSVGTIELSNADGSTIGAIKTTGSDINLGVMKTGLTVELKKASSITGGNLTLSYDTQSVLQVIEQGRSITLFSGEKLDMKDVAITINQEKMLEDLDLDYTKIGETMGIALFELSDNEESTYENVTAQFGGETFLAKFREVRFVDGKIIIDVRGDIYNESTFTENGNAGAFMLNDVVRNSKLSKDSDLEKVLQSMDEVSYNGKNAKADALATAISGATTTSLNAAQMGDMERNLRSLSSRNKMDSISFAEAGSTKFSAWIAAEGGNYDLDTNSTYAGTKLNNQGGSVGVDMQMGENFNAGLAFSAMLGDLSSTAGNDVAKGDMDNLYVSLYANYSSNAWTHTFAMSLGMTDASLDRTVSHDKGSYKTKGDTDGMSFALGYEATYDIALNEEKTTILRPIFNVSLISSSMDGYTEKGTDAALRVSDQENLYASFGAGVGFETGFGENFMNRQASLNLRALVKADVGNRASEADVTLVSGSGYTDSVKGNEPGKVGVEFGAGIALPMSETGSLFMDVSVDLREDMMSLSGGVGYKFSF